MLIEICAQTLTDSIIAFEEGADRVELNSNLSRGGITPSLGLVKKVIAAIDIPIVVLVRPREGDFVYTNDEVSVMLEDIAELCKLDIEGIAIGALTKESEIDLAINHRFVEMIHSAGKKAIFHRAIDATNNIDKSFSDIVELGFDRVVTSALETSAITNIGKMEDLVKTYEDKIEICAGGGVLPEQLNDFMQIGLKQAHASCSKNIEVQGIDLFADDEVSTIKVVSRTLVKNLVSKK